MAEPPAEYVHSKEEFLKVFSNIKQDIISDPLIPGQPQGAIDWMDKMLTYNVPGGKLNRGMAVYDTLAAVKDGSVEPELAFKANILGWCIELLQAFFLVADDIMDNSITRRGQPCWYRQPHVGMVACNDSIILDQSIYSLLRTHFRDQPYYTRLYELFHETTFRTAHGQLLDVITAPIGTVDLSRYTMDTYMRIVTYKTAFYSFYLPCACGMLLSGIENQEAFKVAESIMLPMGQFFQVQDDYLDCYADPEVLGKVGTDIQDNKCSWLICQALVKATAKQRAVFEKNYGKDVPESIEAVKEVFKELELEQLFKAYEEASYKEISGLIENQTLLPPAVFTKMLSKIYKRAK